MSLIASKQNGLNRVAKIVLRSHMPEGGGTLVLLIITFFPQGRVSIFAQYLDGTKYVQNLNFCSLYYIDTMIQGRYLIHHEYEYE
jgi:hypothetical protein